MNARECKTKRKHSIQNLRSLNVVWRNPTFSGRLSGLSNAGFPKNAPCPGLRGGSGGGGGDDIGAAFA